MINQDAFALMEAIRGREARKADLSDLFIETHVYREVRKAIFGVLEAREARLKLGHFEQKGVAVIGQPGIGKSRMIASVIQEYEQVAQATGGREFGHRIISIIVPGQASVKDTCCAILEAIGYPANSTRSELYLIDCVHEQLQHRRIAAIHLDEIQDAGRHSTPTARSNFTKRLRNLMQKAPWPVCLILSSTPEGKEFVNHDGTLTRRLNAIEILPMTFKDDGPTLRFALKKLLAGADLDDQGLIEVDDFIRILMHAAAYRFGVAIELAIEAIGDAVSSNEQVIGLEHFDAAYYARTNCDEELNPFISDQWKAIDTTLAMQRYMDEKKGRPASKRRK